MLGTTTSAIQSWIEPSSAGSRLDWKADRWKYPKLGLIPLTIFSIAALNHLEMSLTVIACLAGSGIVIVQFWLLSFNPRRITVFEDCVEIMRCSGRGSNTRTISYSDIQRVEVGPYKKHYLVTLQLKAQQGVILVTPDVASADRIRDTFEKYNSVSDKSPRPTSGGASERNLHVSPGVVEL